MELSLFTRSLFHLPRSNMCKDSTVQGPHAPERSLLFIRIPKLFMDSPPADDSNSLFRPTTRLLVEAAFPQAFLLPNTLQTRNRDSSVPACSLHHLENMEYIQLKLLKCPLKNHVYIIPPWHPGGSPYACRPNWPQPWRRCRRTSSPKIRPHSPPLSALRSSAVWPRPE